MSDERFNRLEDKVDRVDEKVDKIGNTVTEMRVDTKHQMDTIREHVTADQKIINHIQPLLPILEDLADMVEDHKFDKKSKEVRNSNFKKWGMRAGFTTTILGAISAIYKYWNSFFS